MSYRADRFVLTLCAAVVFLSTSVAAQAEDGLQVSIRGGLSKPKTVTFDVGATSATAAGVTERYGSGYAVEIASGYKLGPLVVEAELGQRSSSLSSIQSTVKLRNSATATAATGAAGNFPGASGSTRVRTVMLNAYLDVTNRTLFENGKVHFFGGAGVGKAWIRAINHMPATNASFVNGGAKSFAWQAMGGIRYDLNAHLSVDVRYKHHAITRLDLTDVDSRKLFGDLSSSNVLLGVNYAF
jgi:OmpA-OmpF porin, OOP family